MITTNTSKDGVNMSFGAIAIELSIGFVILFITTKILGKTQITQITPFDFVSALILGELVGNAVFDKDVKIFHIIFAVALWTCLIYAVELITLKSRKARNILEGEPSIVIRQGKIQRDIMKKNNLDLNQLQQLLRAKGAFSVREVAYAFLETDGTISVLKKTQFDTPTRNDLHLPITPLILPITLISDGKIIEANLKSINKNEAWLKQQLLTFGVSSYKSVFFAEWDEENGLYVDLIEN